jgi:hypothetical protein
MAKTFQEVFNEIKSNVSLSKKGKQIKSFSKTDLDKLGKALLNELEYKTEIVKSKGGELIKEEILPVKKLREGFIKAFLVGVGIDKAEAEKLSQTYQFDNVDGLYEFCSEWITASLEAGKKFEFLPKYDFAGSISMKDVGPSESSYKNIRTKEDLTIRKEAHKLLEKKSKCPKHLKKDVTKKK